MLLEKKKLMVTGVLTPQSIAFHVARIAQEQGATVLGHIERVAGEIETRWGTLDGFLHAIAFAPTDALGGAFLDTPWESVRTAFQTSAYSLKAIAVGVRPLMQKAGGGAIVSLDFDASVAWP